jgi:metallo-beta-lactamase class B
MTPGGKAHPIDRVLHDGDTVALGGTTLTAHLTPGHTRGCTTWTMRVVDRGTPREVVIACGGLQDGARLVNNKNYPEIADDFARSVKTYRTLHPDVFLASHSWFFDLAGKHAKLGGATNPYLDPAGYTRFVDDMEKNLAAMLAEQRKNPPTN